MKNIKIKNKGITAIIIMFLIVTPFVSVFAQEVTPAQDAISADTLTPVVDPIIISGNTTDAQATIPSDTLIQTQDPSTIPSDETASSSTLIDTPTPISDPTPDPTTVPVCESSQTLVNNVCTDPAPNPDPTPDPTTVPVCESSQTLVNNVCTDPAPNPDPAPDPTPVPVCESSQTLVNNVCTDPAPNPDLIDPLEEVLIPVVAEIPVGDINPKESFKFAIHSERIEAKKNPGWRGQVEKRDKKGKIISDTAVVNDVPSIALNSDTGVPVVSGSCSNVYYVILLYKNQTDYDTDPASYIINKAYPCVGGAYSFEIKDLPKSIPNGTYYLMVGGMGETGSWTPMTSLVPIDIMQ